jgi:hypothetical protein
MTLLFYIAYIVSILPASLLFARFFYREFSNLVPIYQTCILGGLYGLVWPVFLVLLICKYIIQFIAYIFHRPLLFLLSYKNPPKN